MKTKCNVVKALVAIAFLVASCATPVPKPQSGPINFAPPGCFAYVEAERPEALLAAIDSYAKALVEAVAQATGQEVPKGLFDGNDSIREFLDSTMRQAFPEQGLALFDLSKPAAVYAFRQALSPALALALPVKDSAAFDALTVALAREGVLKEHIERREGYILFAKGLKDGEKLQPSPLRYGDGTRAIAGKLPESAPGAVRFVVDTKELTVMAGDAFPEIREDMGSIEGLDMAKPLFERILGYARDAATVSGALVLGEQGMRLDMKAAFAEGSEAWAELKRLAPGNPAAIKALAARLPSDPPLAMIGMSEAAGIETALEITGLMIETALGKSGELDNEGIDALESLRTSISLAKEAATSFSGSMAFSMSKGIDIAALLARGGSADLSDSMILALMLGAIPQGLPAVYPAMGFGGEGIAFYECPDPAKAAAALERFIASEGLKGFLTKIGEEWGVTYDFRLDREEKDGTILHKLFSTSGGPQGDEYLLYSAAYGKGLMCSAAGEGSEMAALEGLGRAKGGFLDSKGGKALIAAIDSGYKSAASVDLSRFFGGATTEPLVIAYDWGEGFAALRMDMPIKALLDYFVVFVEQVKANLPEPRSEGDSLSFDGIPDVQDSPEVEDSLLDLMLEIAITYGRTYLDEIEALAAAADRGEPEGFMTQLECFVEAARDPYDSLKQVLYQLSESYSEAYALFPDRTEQLEEVLMEIARLETIIESLEGFLGEDDLQQALEALAAFREW